MQAITLDDAFNTRNPLDLVEEIVGANDWLFERASDDRMFVELQGRWSDYRLYFLWQPDLSAMQFSCQIELNVPSSLRSEVNELLAIVNEKLWLGHFDVCSEENTPLFRHTTLLRGAPTASAEQIEDLIEISVSECERFFPAFQFVISGGKSAQEAVEAAILDPVGEA